MHVRLKVPPRAEDACVAADEVQVAVDLAAGAEVGQRQGSDVRVGDEDLTLVTRRQLTPRGV